MPADDPELLRLMRTVARADTGSALHLLATDPSLANARLERGASRQEATNYFLDEIAHYVMAGDTALHVAAGGYLVEVAQALVSAGADVGARNRRGAQPLHYAADGLPGGAHWNPSAQVATIGLLIEAGADPDATDISGVTPLHRAVRTRCSAAVQALLEGGAAATRPNRSGSTPLKLATSTTGRSGSGSPLARAEQAEIVRRLRLYGATG